MPPEQEKVLQDINEKLAQIIIWQATHDEKHNQIGRDVSDMRDDLYGENGLKNTMTRYAMSPWTSFGLGVLQAVISNGALGFIMWLLFIYKTH